MPYINPGQFIEPYLRPLGKQTIKQIPQIQQEQRAREQLGAQKSVWAEQVAESQANRGIRRDAQARQMELLGLAATNPEAFAKLVPPGTDPETLLKLRFSGAMSPLQAQYPKAITPVWKTRIVKDPITGKLINETYNANDPNAQLKTEVPTKKVKIHGQWKDIDLDTARYIEDQNMENVRADQKRTEDIAEKNKQTEIKYLTDEIEKASRRGDQQWLSMCEQRLADIVDMPTTGKARDPKIDEARSILIEVRQELARYEKIAASQDPADMGAQLAPTSMPQIPSEQFLPLPPKKEPKAPKEPTFTEKRSAAKDAAKAEEAIVNPENEGNPALVGPISIFNRFSDKPYVYIWKTEKQKKGKLWWKKDIETGKTQKIDLPIVNGKQVTAKEVWFTAQENGITMMEVLKLIGAIE